MELSDRFDAWLQDLDVPASEGKLARLDRENRRIRRGRPAKKKPSALRAQALYAKGLAKPFAHNVAPLTGLRSATAPDVGTLGAHRRRRGSCRSGRGTRCPSSRARRRGAGRQHAARAELPSAARRAPTPARGSSASWPRPRAWSTRATRTRPGSPGGLVPGGAPRAPTLAVVCNPPTLVWRDGRERAGGPSLVARSWAWGATRTATGLARPGDDERAIEQRLLGARLAAPRSLGDEEADEDGRRRSAARRGLHRRPLVGLDGAPVAVLKFADGGANGSVGMEARAAGDRVEAEAHPRPSTATGAAARRRATRAFYRARRAARLKALFDVEPHGDDARGKYGVALQAYVKPKGPSAWMVRAVVDAGGGGGARARALAPGDGSKHRGAQPYCWVFSDGDPVATDSARATRPEAPAAAAAPPRCSIGVNGLLPPSLCLRSLAADFVQDEDGRWWMLQIKAARARDGADLGDAWRAGKVPGAVAVVPERASPARAPADDHLLRDNQSLHRYEETCEAELATIAAAGATSDRPCAGQYCDLPVPKAHRHVYGDTLHQGARFSVPRKVVFDKPRADDATAPPPDASVTRLITMTRRERLSLYDTIHVCACCHFQYVGPRAQRAETRGPRAIGAAVDGIVDAARDRDPAERPDDPPPPAFARGLPLAGGAVPPEPAAMSSRTALMVQPRNGTWLAGPGGGTVRATSPATLHRPASQTGRGGPRRSNRFEGGQWKSISSESNTVREVYGRKAKAPLLFARASSPSGGRPRSPFNFTATGYAKSPPGSRPRPLLGPPRFDPELETSRRRAVEARAAV
ncbi:hypothetical protein JL720_5539 [Aureococcus anophagefferens]|nr:hypothetical protein JL720_5539 [Aureococcus anophagefferens]